MGELSQGRKGGGCFKVMCHSLKEREKSWGSSRGDVLKVRRAFSKKKKSILECSTCVLQVLSCYHKKEGL